MKGLDERMKGLTTYSLIILTVLSLIFLLSELNGASSICYAFKLYFYVNIQSVMTDCNKFNEWHFVFGKY